MKKTLATILQFLLFLLAFAAGSFAAPFRVEWFVTHQGTLSTRYFLADGFLIMLLLYVLVLLLEALLKRLRGMALWTSAAFLLATLLGFLMKLGFVTREM